MAMIKFSRLTIFLFTFGLLAFAGNLFGLEIKTVFDIEVPVTQGAPNTKAEQTELIKLAFKNMLVKASGSEKILNTQTVTSALPLVEDYIKQFSYQQPASGARMLQVKFNENKVSNLIESSGYKLLKGNRPAVLLWLVVTENNTTQWVGGEFNQNIVNTLYVNANRYGIPILFPMFDLTDSAIVSEKNVLNGNLEKLQAASKRYNSDVLLIGKLSKQPSGWYAEWDLINNGNSDYWDNSETELDKTIKDGLEGVAHHLEKSSRRINQINELEYLENSTTRKKMANQNKPELLANQNTSEDLANQKKPEVLVNQNLHFGISGILDLRRYGKVVDYLSKLPEVIRVEVEEITPEHTVFQIETNASTEVVIDAIAKDLLLIEVLDTLNLDKTKSINNHDKNRFYYKLAEAQ